MSLSRHLFIVILVLALSPSSARAHSIGDEVSFGNTQPTGSNPTTGFVGDLLRGGIDFTDALSLRLSLGLTYDEPSLRPGAHFRDTGGVIYSSGLGLDWEANNHFDFSVEVDFSPQSTQYYDTTTLIPDPKTNQLVETDSQLRAANGSKGGMLGIGYSTAGDSNLETAIDVGVADTLFNTAQDILRAEQNGRKVGPDVVRSECNHLLTVDAKSATPAQLAQARSNCRAVGLALKGVGTTLNELQLRAAVTETLFVDTDLTLSASYYLYDKDPTQVGFFSTVVRGRSRSGFGNGIPIAPIVYSVRPEASHRFGGFMVDLWYSYNLYYGNQGYGHSVGLKLQYKLTKELKIWASGTLQDDIQPQDTSTTTAAPSSSPPTTSSLSDTVTVGLKYAW